jgi:hypothetical protein
MTNDDSFAPPSSTDQNVAGNTNEGSFESFKANLPPPGDPFYQMSQDAQLDWVLNREAQQRFDQTLDRYIGEINRGYGAGFPGSIKDAIWGLASTLLENDPKAYQAVRDGNPEVAQKIIRHYIQQAHTTIKSVVEDHNNYKGPLDQMNSYLGNYKKFDDASALKRLRAQAEPRVGEVHPNKQKIFDETIAAIFGRR